MMASDDLREKPLAAPPWPSATTVAAATGGAVIVGAGVAVVLFLPSGLLALVAFAFGGAGLFVTLRYPGLAIAALLVLLPFNALATQVLQSHGYGDGPLPIAVGAIKDGTLTMLVMVSVARVLTGRQPRAELPLRLLYLVGGTLLIAAVSGLETDDLAAAAYGLRNDFIPLLWLLVVPLSVGSMGAGRLQALIVGVAQVVSATAVATHSIGLQWLKFLGILTNGGVVSSSYFVSGSLEPRAFSPFVGPNELGLACSITLAILIARNDWKLHWRLICAVLPLAALALSQSRSAAAGLALAAILVIGRSILGRRAIPTGRVFATTVAGLAVAGLSVVLIDPSSLSDLSAAGHQSSLVNTASAMLAHPIGFGVGTVGPRAGRFIDVSLLSESFFGVVGLEAGLMALMLYIATIAGVLSLLLPRILGGGRSSAVATASAAVLAATLIPQLFLPILQDSSLSSFLWIAVATGLVGLPVDWVRRESDETVGARSR